MSAGITGDTAGETETMISVPNHLETAGKRTNDMINPGTNGTDTMIRARALLKWERKRQEVPAVLRAPYPSQLWGGGKWRKWEKGGPTEGHTSPVPSWVRKSILGTH